MAKTFNADVDQPTSGPPFEALNRMEQQRRINQALEALRRAIAPRLATDATGLRQEVATLVSWLERVDPEAARRLDRRFKGLLSSLAAMEAQDGP